MRRWRDASNRRVQRVELTDAGIAMFDRLRDAAHKHDQRLRSRLSSGETAQLAELLDMLQAGVSSSAPAGSPRGRPGASARSRAAS